MERSEIRPLGARFDAFLAALACGGREGIVIAVVSSACIMPAALDVPAMAFLVLFTRTAGTRRVPADLLSRHLVHWQMRV